MKVTSTTEHGLRDMRSAKDIRLRIEGINLDGWKAMLELLGKARVVTCDGAVCLSIFNSHIYTEGEGFLLVCVVRVGHWLLIVS